MPNPVKKRTYQGYSTNVGDGLTTLYDIQLVQQDLLNVFNMRKGESIVDPSKGSIIWDMIFELATPANISLMQSDSVAIFQSDSRVNLIQIEIVPTTDASQQGYVLNAVLQYVGSQVQSVFTVNFLSGLVDNGV